MSTVQPVQDNWQISAKAKCKDACGDEWSGLYCAAFGDYIESSFYKKKWNECVEKCNEKREKRN